MKKYLRKKNYMAAVVLGMALFVLPQMAQAQIREAYVVKDTDSGRLTFYYDMQKQSRQGTVYDIDATTVENGVSLPAWTTFSRTANSAIVKAVFDASFSDYRPTNTAYWFQLYTALQEFEGIEYLNTEDVTEMSVMFGSCESLTSVDLSHFNTSKVTNMTGMFANCTSLTSLDVSGFNISKVSDMSMMFYYCPQLTTIYCNDTWMCDQSTDMFAFCDNLVGAVAYDDSKEDGSMANPDTGYFTKKTPSGIKAAAVTDTAVDNTIYNLQGIRLNTKFEQLPAGLYIVGGRKVMKR